MTVQAGARTVDVVADGSAPLALLLPALAETVGADPTAVGTWWDGGRRVLAGDRSLDDLGVLSGSTLRLLARWSCLPGRLPPRA